MTGLDDYRERARRWLVANASPGDENESEIERAKRFQHALFSAGYAGITWPPEYGGQGLSTDELVAFNEAAADFELPVIPLSIGMGMAGPTILELGTHAQKSRYIPALLRGDEVWCQMFSEPDAGSDVAGLRTKAVRTDAGWLLDGRKVWTSNAQWADFGVILARTDSNAPKHRGITMFIVDMREPGVTVRPLVVATGEAPFNEVVLDGVLVAQDAVLGEVNRGWEAAVAMLRHERVSIGTRVQKRANALGFDNLAELARRRGVTGDVTVRRRLAEAYVRESAVLAYGRVLQAEGKAGIEVGPRGSVAKLAGAELRLWQASVAQEILGPDVALGDPEFDAVALGMVAAPGVATAGGTNEIQRNIIAERILGLPKDGGIADRNTPFNRIRTSRRAGHEAEG
ncbi:acyl-CoA dehydrogenase family protein [Amycolatopsis sp. GM8]|uniref:acyl-CoA dehydrogenase family protein n=1 Tax=Amycolatopsis sp. GM8 TaxID=2896530 RepID=UPI001F37F268|nr:acyl-CoA dehydrogenase family protein [Amycolatopsis sp. GM8]